MERKSSVEDLDVKISSKQSVGDLSPYPGIEDLRHRFLSFHEKEAESKSPPHGFHYLCCVDGSTNSHLAYNVTRSLKKKTDCLTVFHSYQERRQDELPEKYRAMTIYEQYLQEAELESKNSVTLCWEAREDRSIQSTIRAYLDMASETFNPPDFVVLGTSHENTSESDSKSGYERSHSHPPHHIPRDGITGPSSLTTSLSSNCEWILRTCPLSLILVKKDIPLRREKKFWMMAVDDCPSSQHGLTLVSHLINPHDTLLLFHVHNEDKETRIQLTKVSNYYEDVLATTGPTINNFIILEQERGVDLGHSIATFVNDNRPDLFAFAPRAKTRLSRTMENILNLVECSIVVCKG
jgi:hypothetical protein